MLVIASRHLLKIILQFYFCKKLFFSNNIVILQCNGFKRYKINPLIAHEKLKGTP